MFIFGHTGITLGVAVLLSGKLIRSHTPPRTNALEGQPQWLHGLPVLQNCCSGGITSWPYSLASHIDIRLLLTGSLLPDIIDKPVGWVLFEDIFSNGRTFCHTLLFLTILILVGLYLYWRRKKTWLLVLSFGTFTHVILDEMWLTPRTLLWPLYGLQFEKVFLNYWIRGIIHDVLDNPIMCIPELTGAVVIAWFVWVLVRRGKLYTFLRKGQLK